MRIGLFKCLSIMLQVVLFMYGLLVFRTIGFSTVAARPNENWIVEAKIKSPLRVNRQAQLLCTSNKYMTYVDITFVGQINGVHYESVIATVSGANGLQPKHKNWRNRDDARATTRLHSSTCRKCFRLVSIFFNAKHTDAGEYVCNAQDRAGQQASSEPVGLIVSGPRPSSENREPDRGNRRPPVISDDLREVLKTNNEPKLRFSASSKATVADAQVTIRCLANVVLDYIRLTRTSMDGSYTYYLADVDRYTEKLVLNYVDETRVKSTKIIRHPPHCDECLFGIEFHLIVTQFDTADYLCHGYDLNNKYYLSNMVKIRISKPEKRNSHLKQAKRPYSDEEQDTWKTSPAPLLTTRQFSDINLETQSTSMYDFVQINRQSSSLPSPTKRIHSTISRSTNPCKDDISTPRIIGKSITESFRTLLLNTKYMSVQDSQHPLQTSTPQMNISLSSVTLSYQASHKVVATDNTSPRRNYMRYDRSPTTTSRQQLAGAIERKSAISYSTQLAGALERKSAISNSTRPIKDIKPHYDETTLHFDTENLAPTGNPTVAAQQNEFTNKFSSKIEKPSRNTIGSKAKPPGLLTVDIRGGEMKIRRQLGKVTTNRQQRRYDEIKLTHRTTHSFSMPLSTQAASKSSMRSDHNSRARDTKSEYLRNDKVLQNSTWKMSDAKICVTTFQLAIGVVCCVICGMISVLTPLFVCYLCGKK